MSRPAARRQGGFTLVELLMGIILSSIFAIALFAFFFAGVDSARTSEAQARAQAESRTTLDRMARDIRQAVSPDRGVTAPIVALTPTSLTMYVDPSRVAATTTLRPQLVRYAVIANQLVREAVDPVGTAWPFTYGSFTTAPDEVMVEALSPGSTPFTAYTQDGALLPASMTTLQIRSIAQISIRLRALQRTGNSTTTLEISTDVALRNALPL